MNGQRVADSADWPREPRHYRSADDAHWQGYYQQPSRPRRPHDYGGPDQPSLPGGYRTHSRPQGSRPYRTVYPPRQTVDYRSDNSPMRPVSRAQLLSARQHAGIAALLALSRATRAAQYGLRPPRPAPRLRLASLAGVPRVHPRARELLGVGALTGTILGSVIALHVIRLPDGHAAVRLGWYGSAVVVLLAAKLIGSLLAQPLRNSAKTRTRLTVGGVITCRNEDPQAFIACLESVLRSTRLPDMLTVVDDASSSAACRDIARSFAAEFRAAGVAYHVVVFRENFGKRAGLATGFRNAWDADVYLCIDSDTTLHPLAIENALKPFTRRRVHAVTGCVLAANWGRNLLTRLIDLRYCYAFLGERAAYSLFGSVLCACGSLALYRGATVRKYLDDFLTQRFLGRACTYGDDRRLTYYCLREGKVLLAPDAVAWTLVPVTMTHFLRQQVRWSKSFFRESMWLLFTIPPFRVCWWFTLVEISTWCGFTTALVYSLSVRPALTGHFTALAYLLAVLILSYARSGHYLEVHHRNLTSLGKATTLLLAPVYGLIHMTLLLPLRLIALVTLKDNSWGTRKAVEVGS